MNIDHPDTPSSACSGYRPARCSGYHEISGSRKTQTTLTAANKLWPEQRKHLRPPQAAVAWIKSRSTGQRFVAVIITERKITTGEDVTTRGEDGSSRRHDQTLIIDGVPFWRKKVNGQHLPAMKAGNWTGRFYQAWRIEMASADVKAANKAKNREACCKSKTRIVKPENSLSVEAADRV